MAWQKAVEQKVSVTFYSGGVPTAPTGALSATISKDGAGFGAVGGSVAQIESTPTALLTLSTADTNCDTGVVKITDAGGTADDRYVEFTTEATYTAAVAAHVDVDVSSRAPSGEYDTELDAAMSSRAASGEAAAAVATLNDFDPTSDTVTHVALVDTTTANTDMRGTDNAALATSLATVAAGVLRVLGLVQENQYIDNVVTDSRLRMTSARLRTYSAAGSVGTANDVLATYTITATYTGTEEAPTTYKVVKA